MNQDKMIVPIRSATSSMVKEEELRYEDTIQDAIQVIDFQPEPQFSPLFRPNTKISSPIRRLRNPISSQIPRSKLPQIRSYTRLHSAAVTPEILLKVASKSKPQIINNKSQIYRSLIQ